MPFNGTRFRLHRHQESTEVHRFRAVEPLISPLEDGDDSVCVYAAEALESLVTNAR